MKTGEICEKASSKKVRLEGGQRIQRLNTDNKVGHEQKSTEQTKHAQF